MLSRFPTKRRETSARGMVIPSRAKNAVLKTAPGESSPSPTSAYNRSRDTADLTDCVIIVMYDVTVTASGTNPYADGPK